MSIVYVLIHRLYVDDTVTHYCVFLKHYIYMLSVCVCVSDLRWVQVNSSDEAFKVMKLGKKNQSISSTKLNQLSSRR